MCLRIDITTLWSFQCLSVFFHCTLYFESRQCLWCLQTRWQINNYRPISLLSFVEKVLERLIFKRLFSFLQENNVLTSIQSGFIPGGSSVNELKLLYNVFCKALDDELDVRSVFFDISKAFDRLWHKGLLHKLKSTGVSGELLLWFKHYLTGR